MILNAATLLWRLHFMRAIPVEAKLLTWECMTTFDEIPAQGELESLFEKEFPRTCLRLQESGGFFRIWHLVSFNSAEGRRSRFLVALVESPLHEQVCGNFSRRALPRQIYLTAMADRLIRESGTPAENDGNYLCFAQAEGRLFVLVFFEGRLCHWSEDYVGPQANLDQVLSRFRRFLESDALFSRAKHFEEIPLQGDFSPALFNQAARDSFWRGRNLCKSEAVSTNAVKLAREFVYDLLGRKWLWLLALAVIGVIWNWRSDADWNAAITNAVTPVSIELSLPPDWAAVEEATPVVAKTAVELPRCGLPEFSLKGVVSEKIAMVSVVEDSGNSSRTLAVGDSLGSFVLLSIGRDHVELACGDSLLVRKVGAHEP